MLSPDQRGCAVQTNFTIVIYCDAMFSGVCEAIYPLDVAKVICGHTQMQFRSAKVNF